MGDKKQDNEPKVTREEFEELKRKVDDLETLWDRVRNMLLTVAGIYRGVKDKGEKKDD